MNKRKYKYLSKNILLFSISSFGQKILAFFLVPLYTGVLSTSQYGTIDLVSTTVSLLVPIFSLSISEAVMRFTISDKENDDYISCGLIVIIKGALLLLLVLSIGILLPISLDYKIQLGWIYVLFLLNSLYSLYQNYYRAIDKVNVMIVGSLLNSFVMMVINVIVLTVFHMGVYGYLGSMVLGLLSAIFYMELVCGIRNKVHFKLQNYKSVKSECVKYSVPAIFITLAWWVNSSLDKYFVTVLCGVGQNGIYSISYKIPTLLGVCATIFNQAWSLSSIQEFDKHDTDGFFGKMYSFYASMLALVCSGIILVNVLLSRILFAKDFFIAWKCVPLLLESALFSALAGYFGGIFSAAKDTKIMAYTTVFSAFINILLNSFLIPRYGIVGAALATMIAYFCSMIIRMHVSRKYVELNINYCSQLVTYFLISLQVCCATTESHMYLCQIICISLLVLTNIKVYISIIKQSLEIIRSKLNQN